MVGQHQWQHPHGPSVIKVHLSAIRDSWWWRLTGKTEERVGSWTINRSTPRTPPSVILQIRSWLRLPCTPDPCTSLWIPRHSGILKKIQVNGSFPLSIHILTGFYAGLKASQLHKLPPPSLRPVFLLVNMRLDSYDLYVLCFIMWGCWSIGPSSHYSLDYCGVLPNSAGESWEDYGQLGLQTRLVPYIFSTSG